GRCPVEYSRELVRISLRMTKDGPVETLTPLVHTPRRKRVPVCHYGLQVTGRDRCLGILWPLTSNDQTSGVIIRHASSGRLSRLVEPRQGTVPSAATASWQH